MNEKDKALEDLKLIKMMIDRTKEAIDPAAPIIILWGVLVFIGNMATHFLLTYKFPYSYIGYTWGGIGVAGFIVSMIMGSRIGRRWYKYRINSFISVRLALIWTIIVPVGVV